jgi:hypothetical protein
LSEAASAADHPSLTAALHVAVTEAAAAQDHQSAGVPITGPVAGQNLMFYFAWVDPSETTFNPSVHLRWDENVLSSVIEHDEGQIPVMTIIIRNPQVGLLSPGRKFWAWFAVSLDNGVTAIPLFFGRLIGLPTDIDPTALAITIKFMARALNYVQLKQAAAEPLKILPYYDRLFIDVLKRDDPDTIIEAYSALYHSDRTTLAVTVSDVLEGEDGTVVFTGVGDTIMNSVKRHLDQSPLVAVNVKANVKWSQQWTGFFDVASGSIATYTGEAFAADWPSVGSNLGGGYSVAVGFAGNATYDIDLAQTMGNYSLSYHYENLSSDKHTGDVNSLDMSYSVPSLGVTKYIPGQALTFPFVGTPGTIVHQYENVQIIGILNPDAVDLNGDPAPINQPARVMQAWIVIPQWTVAYALSLRYEANRQRSERIEFTLQSDVQPTITDALATEDMEAITIAGGDASLPIINLENWQSVAGQPVALGQYIFPNNPFAIGQTSTQVAIVAGTAGTVEPLFSNIAGTPTVDGTVTWNSLGDTAPTDSLPDWQRDTPTALGTMMCPRPVAAIDENSLLIPAGLQFPPKPVGVSQFEVLANGLSQPGALLLECTVPGFIIPPGAMITTTSPASFNSFTNPTGQSAWLATGFTSGSSGSTGLFRPSSFPDTQGAVVTDGGVKWTNIGPIDLPIGGFPGMTGRSSYFPSDRGLQSIGYLIARARARLRWRSRVARITWQCPYAKAIPLTCRKNATVVDPRLPEGGHGITGKVIGYKLVADGDKGLYYGEVTIGCAAGTGGSGVIPNPGSPDYVASDYVIEDYQVQIGATLNPPGGPDDVAFSRPLPATVDDGLVFPLAGTGDAILNAQFGGSAADEQLAIQNAIDAAQFSLPSGNPNLTQTYGFDVTVVGGSSVSLRVTQPNWLAVRQALEMSGKVGVWWSGAFKPLTTGPFSAGYVLSTSLLAIPMTINLEA